MSNQREGRSAASVQHNVSQRSERSNSGSGSSDNNRGSQEGRGFGHSRR